MIIWTRLRNWLCRDVLAENAALKERVQEVTTAASELLAASKGVLRGGSAGHWESSRNALVAAINKTQPHIGVQEDIRKAK